MKILLDARKLGDGGIGVYIENLVDGLLALHGKGVIQAELSLLVTPNFYARANFIAAGSYQQESRPLDSGSHKIGQHDTGPADHAKHALGRACTRLNSGAAAILDAMIQRWSSAVRLICEPSGKYSLSELLVLPLRQRREILTHDIYHSPHYTLPAMLPCPAVVTIHDLIHLSHPETIYHRPIAGVLVRSAMKRASQIISVSHDTLARVRELMGTDCPPVTVIPNALRASLVRRSRIEVQDFTRREFLVRPYCLFVGSERPHKGFWDLLDAWRQMSAEQSELELPDLVVVGRRFSSARERVREYGLESSVRFMGEVSGERLELLYSGASAVLVPSRAEGFGLPALEALGMGVPVICSPIPVLAEVCGDAGIYAEEHSGAAYARAIQSLFADPEMVERRVSLGLTRALRYSLEECALKTWAVYERALGRIEVDPRPNAVRSEESVVPLLATAPLQPSARFS